MFFSKIKFVLCAVSLACLLACSGSERPRKNQPKPTKSPSAVQTPTPVAAQDTGDFNDSPFASRTDKPQPREVASTNTGGDSPFSSGDSDSVFAQRTDDFGYESGLSQRAERDAEVEFAPQGGEDEPPPESAFSNRKPDPLPSPKPRNVERKPAPAPERDPAPLPSPRDVAARDVERPSAPAPTPRSTAKPKPASYPNDIAKLAFELTQDKATDREKVHAIYTWLCQNLTYDTKAYFSGDYGDNSPETALRRRMCVCAGYANLFTAMADEIGLQSKVVVGHSKGYGFEPGEEEAGGKHAWNAVKVDGEWALLDATWGSGYIDTEKQFVRRVTDDWFLTPPKAFIYTHLPDEVEWQLLDKQLTAEEYGALPQVNPSFFRYGLRLGVPQTGTVNCDESTTIELHSDTGAEIHANIAVGKERLPLESTMVFQKGKSIKIKARFPKPGDYELLVFASLPGEEKSSHVMSYRVKASASAKSLFPYAYRDYEERNCELIEGFDKTLKADRHNLIKIKVPGATKVSAKNGDTRHPFEKSGDVFTLDLKPNRGEVKILTHYEGRRRLPVVLRYEAI